MSDIRVRFAPSPTGHIHVGNVRTALFNYLFAKNKKGTFILRIEDTDLERSTEESEKLIYEDLRWLGINWDEGEGIGGAYGPYTQTARADTYIKAQEQLLANGSAYYCFCSEEELEEARGSALKNGRPPLYNGRCRDIPREEALARIKNGEKPSVRFKVKKSEVLVKDLIHGDVAFPTDSFGDFIIVRPNGVPIYNFAVVVDDALMAVTHVIRGDDHLSNTPKQVLLFQELGYAVPLFAHIPMILGPDRSKLSKRHGNTSVEPFRADGYLPEALVNYLALLSWSSPDEEEIFSVQDLTEKFSLDRVAKSAAVFDFDKLKGMNGLYIRKKDISEITDLAAPYLAAAGYNVSDPERLTGIVSSVRDSLDVISDITRSAEVYFNIPSGLDDESRDILNLPTSKAVLEGFLAELNAASSEYLSLEEYKTAMKNIQKSTGAKGKPLYMAVRVGVTHRTKGPELDRFIPLMPVKVLTERVQTLLCEL
jgi:glutamyl-tRNA synthetase